MAPAMHAHNQVAAVPKIAKQTKSVSRFPSITQKKTYPSTWQKQQVRLNLFDGLEQWPPTHQFEYLQTPTSQ